MKRLVSNGYREVISGALEVLTPTMQDRLRHVDFLCGVDPRYLGFTHTSYTFKDGRTVDYSNLAYCMYAFAQDYLLPSNERVTTIVLPQRKVFERYGWPPGVVLHELGHALHEALDFDWAAEPVTDYALENEDEAFADAFEVWATPVSLGSFECAEYQRAIDPKTIAFFEQLSREG